LPNFLCPQGREVGKMRSYSCIAEMESSVVDTDGLVYPGIIGKLGDKEVRIKGKVVTKGYFPRLCIRWESGEGKGLFGKGLISYSGRPIDPDRLRLLPRVK